MALVGVRLLFREDDDTQNVGLEYRLDEDGEAGLSVGEDTMLAEEIEDSGVRLGAAAPAELARDIAQQHGITMSGEPDTYYPADGPAFLAAFLATYQLAGRSWAEPIIE